MQARHMKMIYINCIKKCFDASCSTVMDFLLIKESLSKSVLVSYTCTGYKSGN